MRWIWFWIWWSDPTHPFVTTRSPTPARGKSPASFRPPKSECLRLYRNNSFVAYSIPITLILSPSFRVGVGFLLSSRLIGKSVSMYRHRCRYRYGCANITHIPECASWEVHLSDVFNLPWGNSEKRYIFQSSIRGIIYHSQCSISFKAASDSHVIFFLPFLEITDIPTCFDCAHYRFISGAKKLSITPLFLDIWLLVFRVLDRIFLTPWATKLYSGPGILHTAYPPPFSCCFWRAIIYLYPVFEKSFLRC